MNLNIPSKIAKVGGVLISISGVVNAILGMRIGATFYDAYPGGKMGHVGVIAGVAAVVIGLIILFLIIPIYKKKNRLLVLSGGVLTIVFGHIGGIAGAIYVGTAGVVLCYTAGVWVIVAVVRGLRRREV
ncbi:MAG: hypothetical protein KAJ17_03690 [Candidatus Krumholzibacteria bacterium]|nr:hypothetical protein [Candidatus Krumholzibacteria bacterium]